MSKTVPDQQAIQLIILKLGGHLEQWIKDVTVVKKQLEALTQTKDESDR